MSAAVVVTSRLSRRRIARALVSLPGAWVSTHALVAACDRLMLAPVGSIDKGADIEVTGRTRRTVTFAAF